MPLRIRPAPLLALSMAAAAYAIPAPPSFLLALQVDLEPSPELLAATARILEVETARTGSAPWKGSEVMRIELKPGATPEQELGVLADAYSSGIPGSIDVPYPQFFAGLQMRIWEQPGVHLAISEVFTRSHASSTSLKRAPEGFHLTYTGGSNCYAGCTESWSSTYAFDHEGYPLGPVDPEASGDGEENDGAPGRDTAAPDGPLPPGSATPSYAGLYGLPSTGKAGHRRSP